VRGAEICKWKKSGGGFTLLSRFAHRIDPDIEVNMDGLKLGDVMNRGEDLFNQFKINFYSIDKLAVEICAFANSDGGKTIC